MGWKVKDISCKGPGNVKYKLKDPKDPETILFLFDDYFPNWGEKLYTLPHITRIRRKTFFREKYDSETGEITSEGMKDHIYDTEIMEVLQTIAE